MFQELQCEEIIEKIQLSVCGIVECGLIKLTLDQRASASIIYSIFQEKKF